MAMVVADILWLIAELRPPPVTSIGGRAQPSVALSQGPSPQPCGVPCVLGTSRVVQMASRDPRPCRARR